MTTPTIQIRGASEGDADTIARLAALDSQRPFAGATLIAEVDGDPRAALSLESGRVVADPFRHTASLVELLQIHARELAARPAPLRAVPAPSAPRLSLAA